MEEHTENHGALVVQPNNTEPKCRCGVILAGIYIDERKCNKCLWTIERLWIFKCSECKVMCTSRVLALTCLKCVRKGSFKCCRCGCGVGRADATIVETADSDYIDTVFKLYDTDELKYLTCIKCNPGEQLDKISERMQRKGKKYGSLYSWFIGKKCSEDIYAGYNKFTNDWCRKWGIGWNKMVESNKYQLAKSLVIEGRCADIPILIAITAKKWGSINMNVLLDVPPDVIIGYVPDEACRDRLINHQYESPIQAVYMWTRQSKDIKEMINKWLATLVISRILYKL